MYVGIGVALTSEAVASVGSCSEDLAGKLLGKQRTGGQ